jgi:hypothetical protein
VLFEYKEPQAIPSYFHGGKVQLHLQNPGIEPSLILVGFALYQPNSPSVTCQFTPKNAVYNDLTGK